MREHSCNVDWLFDLNGPNDPVWLARIRAEAAHEPVLVKAPPQTRNGWVGRFACCRVCGTTEGRNFGHGRCNACAHYWRRHGAERPARFWQKERAS